MRTESGLLCLLSSNIFITLVAFRLGLIYFTPSTLHRPILVLFVCLPPSAATASTIYHWDFASFRASRIIWCLCVLLVTRPVQYINSIPCPEPQCPLLCTHKISAALSDGTFCQIAHQLAEFMDNFLSCMRMGPYLTRLNWERTVISLILRKFRLQILINFHGVIPGVLGIFYYNWSLFNVEENIWISKIPSDTHPHPGLIWYLESYPSITM